MRSLILSTIAGLIFLSSVSYGQEPTALEKYQANKKSIVGGIVLQVFCAGAGNQLYERNYAKMIAYPALYYGSIVTGIVLSQNVENRNNGAMAYCILAASAIEGISLIDLALTYNDYNQRLLERFKLTANLTSIQFSMKF